MTGPAKATAPLAIRIARKARFFNAVDLVNRLATDAKLGRHGRIADGLARIDLIILDDRGYLPFASSAVSCCSISPAAYQRT